MNSSNMESELASSLQKMLKLCQADCDLEYQRRSRQGEQREQGYGLTTAWCTARNREKSDPNTALGKEHGVVRDQIEGLECRLKDGICSIV